MIGTINRIRIGRVGFVALLSSLPRVAAGQAEQQVEGFEGIEFHHNANRGAATRDFRGSAAGYMTAGWWAPGQMVKNVVSWKTAVVPAAQPTTFTFVGATSVLPSEFSRGPEAKLTIDGRYALTFTLGVTRDFTWKEGDYELKYLSRRIEFPYFGMSRQGELHGNSGIYQLTVPAAALESGKPSLLQVEILPFPAWSNGWFMVKERRDVLSPSPTSVRGEIDSLRHDLAFIQQHTQILATQVYADLLGTRELEHQVVYTNGFKHLHPADVIRLQTGDLLLMAREATEHYARDGDVVMLRSKDGGKTWDGRQLIAAAPELDEREGCGVQLRDGTIVVGIYYNGLYLPDGSYGGGGLKREPGKHYLGTYIITSRDNGHTWSEPNYINLSGSSFTGLEGPTDAPIELPDGSLLMAVIGYRAASDPEGTSSIMLRSVDQGRSWSHLSTIASDPGQKLGGFVEPGIVRTKSGRIIAALRNGGPDHAIYVTHSDDEGKTWTPIRKTNLHGHPVDLIQLADGRVMATYGVRAPVHAKPGGIRACFSRDNGETWDVASEIQLRNDFMNWDVGYPESLELPGGKVLSVYYYNLFGKYFIGSTLWKPAPPPSAP